MTIQLAFNAVTVPAVPCLADLPARERPAQRICDEGANVCSTAELLAVLIGSKDALAVAHRLLAGCENLADLRRLSDYELSTVQGVGPTTIARFRAALELGQRLNTLPAEKPAINSPSDAAQLLIPEMSAFDQEHMRVLLLDTRHRVMAVTELYVGSVNSAAVRVGEVFKEAVRRNAPAIVIAHNHPSGDPSPSPDDVAVTRMIVEAGRLLDIQVLDHLVIGANRFVSLKERGLGF